MSLPEASQPVLRKRKKMNYCMDDYYDLLDDNFPQTSDFDSNGDVEDDDDDDDVVFIKQENKEENAEDDDDDDVVLIKKQYADEDAADDEMKYGENIDEDVDMDVQYNERMEDLPKLPAYHPDLPKVTARLTGTIQEILKIIEAHPCDSNHVQNLKNKAQGLLEIPKPKAIKIALLGDTGAGKSSLLNSIIDIPDLARALGSGESCTCVATEYETAFPRQQMKFAAEIQYFDTKSIATLLKDHIDSYMEFHFRFDALWDEDLRNQNKRRADTALKVFRALFCQKKEFLSVDAAQKYLNSKRDLKSMVDQMHKWVEELLSSEGNSVKPVDRYLEADTTSHFRKEVDPLLTSSSNDAKPSLWPLVKFVRVGIKGSRVLDKITIADLPGISDTNQAKVNASLDRLRTCDCLWIVVPISRAVDSVTVDSLFSRYEERFRDKIAIICTRADDDVSKGLATELEAQQQSTTEYKKYSKMAKDLQGAISSVRIKIGARMRAQATIMRAQKVRPLRTELRGLVNKKDKAENKMWSSLVDSRNEFVTKGLEKAMQGHLSDDRKPKVFCVSNEHYLNIKTGDRSGRFQLSAKDTGVPTLRSYALSLAAPGVLQAVDDYIKHHYTVFLNGVSLWAISRYVEGADRLLKIVRQPHDGLDKKLEHYCSDLEAHTKDQIEDKLNAKVVKFSTDALTLFERKRGERHWATIKAFMKIPDVRMPKGVLE